MHYATPDEIIHDVHSMLDRAWVEGAAVVQPPPTLGMRHRRRQRRRDGVLHRTVPDGSRNGIFYFNASEPSRWTRFALAPTTFHEAIPGHHLQPALAQELDVHPVLGELEVTAYGEGWGLYAERLADEMGLYATPLQRVGMLTLDSLRASRLVVDTGIHAKGSTRQQAIGFLYDNTALAASNVEAETDTSPIPGRQSATWSAVWKSTGYEPQRSAGSATDSPSGVSTTRSSTA